MEIAILVFFIAIFGGVLFLLGLVWFIFRRIRNSRPIGRNFSSGSGYSGQESSSDDDDDSYMDSSNVAFTDTSTVGGQSDDSSVLTAQDSPFQSEGVQTHESHGSPAETSYTESSYSGGDSGSSYDSGSSSDSSSASSDSGGSSWSSD